MKKFLFLIIVILLIENLSAIHVIEQQVYGELCEGIINLPNQEVAAYYPLIADFGLGPNNEFEYLGQVEDINITCEKILGPENLVAYKTSSGRCKVRWDNGAPYVGENPTNDEQGSHKIEIKVSNEHNESANYLFNITVYSWVINLEEGWNLISIPYVPTNISIIGNQVGFSDILNKVGSIWSYQFNGEKNEWKIYRKENSDTLYEIVPGRGYWIKMNESAQIKGFGTKIGQTEIFPGFPPSVDVPTNAWSLIGRYGILGKENYYFPGETCFDAGSISKEEALKSLIKNDNEVQLHDKEFNLVEEIYNNRGYWIWVEDNFENNSDFESYAPLDKYYTEQLSC